MLTPTITVTLSASQKLRQLAQKDPKALYLTIHTYTDAAGRTKPKLSFSDSQGDYMELKADALPLLIQAKDASLLDGLVIDYSAQLIGGGFRFQKEASKAKCSCGKSLSL